MDKKLASFLIFLLPLISHGQSKPNYSDEIQAFRENYKASLMEGKHGLKPSDTGYLRFYEPDITYQVKGVFEQVVNAIAFPSYLVHGTKGPIIKEYGYVYFTLKGAPVTLHIYRFLTRPEDNTDASIRLFIPFTDFTNYKETFEGGRYLDVSVDDIKDDNTLILDFNKCYNPHTAYEKGYPYIAPPRENALNIKIKAGEKIFGHNPGY